MQQHAVPSAARWALACLFVLASSAGLARAQAPAGDLYQQLPTFDYGDGEETLKAITQQITDAKPADYPAIEAKLVAAIQAPGAKLAGQQFAFRMLRLVGSAKCVPAIASFLTNEKLSHMARAVLYVLKDASAEQALCDAAGKTTGALRIGIINTLGDKRDPAAVPVLAKLIGSDDATTTAAVRAIGRIASPESAQVLQSVKVADSIAWALYDAQLQCAKGLAQAGNADAARAISMALFDGKAPSLIRAAALTQIARLDGPKTLPMVLDGFKSEDKFIRQGAAGAIIALVDPSVNYAVAKELPKLPSSAKMALLDALVARNQRNGLTEAVNALVSDQDFNVRVTAIAALKTLGDSTSVAVLTGVLKTKDLDKEATQTLRGLWADGVAAELMKKAQDGDPEIRAAVIEILGDRRESEALPLALQCVGSDNKAIRQAAIKALGSLGKAAEIEKMVTALVNAKEDSERDALGQAIQNAAKRIEDVDGRVAPIIKAIDGAQPSAQAQLISVLKALGGKNAMQAVTKCLGSTSPEVKKAALRGLTEWVDDAPMNSLKQMAKDSTDEADKILALRGFIRMIGLPKNRKAAEAVPLYQEAIALATRPNEKIQAIGGLGNIKDVKALKAVALCFADKALKTEAMNAAVKIADQIGKKNNAKDVHPVLEQVLQEAPNDALKNRAKSAMEKLSQ